MFPALGSLLARSVAPAVAEQLARHGVQALRVRLRRDPSLAPAMSAEIVAAVNHYDAVPAGAPAHAWTRQGLFAFVAFFVSPDANGALGWIETPERIADYVLRGPRPGEDPASERAPVAAALVAEMETVRELIVRYLEVLAAEAPTAQAPEPAGEVTAEPVWDPAHARLNDLLARAAGPAGAALAQARERARTVGDELRRAGEARKARALVAQSLKLLHAGGVGLAQAEAYLLRKGYPAEIVRAVVAERIRGG